MSSLGIRLLSMLLPNRCPYCRTLIHSDMTECAACRVHFPLFPRIEPVPSGAVCTAPFTYDTTVREAIIRFKFQNKKHYANSFARAAAQAVGEVYKDMQIDVITAVPLSAQSRRERGYNQSELVARKIGNLLDIPYEELLLKNKQNRVQHELNYEERLVNVQGVYIAPRPAHVLGKTILLTDDIMTTGSTLSECCKVLKKNGAKSVLCVVVAMGGGTESAFSQ